MASIDDNLNILEQKLDNAKKTLADNLTAKGVASTTGDTLVQQANKVAQIQAGKEPVLNELTATENKVYTPASGVDGFNKVSVNVLVPTLKIFSTKENGTFNAPQGTAYNQVEVNVPQSGGGDINWTAAGSPFGFNNPNSNDIYLDLKQYPITESGCFIPDFPIDITKFHYIPNAIFDMNNDFGYKSLFESRDSKLVDGTWKQIRVVNPPYIYTKKTDYWDYIPFKEGVFSKISFNDFNYNDLDIPFFDSLFENCTFTSHRIRLNISHLDGKYTNIPYIYESGYYKETRYHHYMLTKNPNSDIYDIDLNLDGVVNLDDYMDEPYSSFKSQILDKYATIRLDIGVEYEDSPYHSKDEIRKIRAPFYQNIEDILNRCNYLELFHIDILGCEENITSYWFSSLGALFRQRKESIHQQFTDRLYNRNKNGLPDAVLQVPREFDEDPFFRDLANKNYFSDKGYTIRIFGQ